MFINFQEVSEKATGRAKLADQLGYPLAELASFLKPVNLATFQQCYNEFVQAQPVFCQQLNQMRPEGIGPGELIAWFVFDDLHLGGKNSPLDLWVNGEPFAEVKAGKYRKRDHSITDFKLSKDTDTAVSLLLDDLRCFNQTHQLLTSQGLVGYSSTSIKATTINAWKQLNLSLIQATSASLQLHRCGKVTKLGDSTALTSWNEPTFIDDLVLLLEGSSLIDQERFTLEQIIQRWKDRVFTEYLANKRLAVINTSSLRLEYLGMPDKSQIDLLRIHRNQPWALIYLPLGSTQ